MKKPLFYLKNLNEEISEMIKKLNEHVPGAVQPWLVDCQIEDDIPVGEHFRSDGKPHESAPENNEEYILRSWNQSIFQH